MLVIQASMASYPGIRTTTDVDSNQSLESAATEKQAVSHTQQALYQIVDSQGPTAYLQEHPPIMLKTARMPVQNVLASGSPTLIHQQYQQPPPYACYQKYQAQEQMPHTSTTQRMPQPLQQATTPTVPQSWSIPALLSPTETVNSPLEPPNSQSRQLTSPVSSGK